MDINELIAIVKKKLQNEINIESLQIEAESHSQRIGIWQVNSSADVVDARGRLTREGQRVGRLDQAPIED